MVLKQLFLVLPVGRCGEGSSGGKSAPGPTGHYQYR